MCTFQWITWALSGSRGRKKFLLRGRNLTQEQAHITRVCLQTNRLTRTSNSNHSWYYGPSVEVLKGLMRSSRTVCAHVYVSTSLWLSREVWDFARWWCCVCVYLPRLELQRQLQPFLHGLQQLVVQHHQLRFALQQLGFHGFLSAERTYRWGHICGNPRPNAFQLAERRGAHFSNASSLSYSACWRSVLSSAPFPDFTYSGNRQEGKVMFYLRLGTCQAT